MLFTGFAAVSTFLAALSDETRRMIFSSVGVFFLSNLFFILAVIGMLLASITIVYALAYWVPYAYLRKYWPCAAYKVQGSDVENTSAKQAESQVPYKSEDVK
jgi:predicted membrane protein